jgi:hypothetical protein
VVARRPAGALIVGEGVDVHQHRAIRSVQRIDKNRRRRSFFDAPSSDERDMLYTGATERLDLTRHDWLSPTGN